MSARFIPLSLLIQLLLASLLAGCLAANSTPAQPVEKQELHSVMQSASAALRFLVEEIVSGEDDSGKSPEFFQALDDLQSTSYLIGDHTTGQDSGLDLVSRSLEINVNQLARNYKAGHQHIGEAFLIETIDHCATCHAQSPALQSDIEIDSFVDTVKQKVVEPGLAARILVAVRRFDDAFGIWQQQFLSDSFNLAKTGAEEALLEYVSQTVHLNRGTTEVVELLNTLSERPSTPLYMRRKSRVWVDQLSLIEHIRNRQYDLQGIQSGYEQCLRLEGYSMQENYPLCNVLVSALSGQMLMQYQEKSPVTDSQLYLNMGIARMNLGLPSGFVPQIEHYLEAAILAAPDSIPASSAYAYLEEIAVFLYGDIEVADEAMEVSVSGLKKLVEIE